MEMPLQLFKVSGATRNTSAGTIVELMSLLLCKVLCTVTTCDTVLAISTVLLPRFTVVALVLDVQHSCRQYSSSVHTDTADRPDT